MRTYTPLSNESKRRIELLLAERISLEAICRVMEIKPRQLYAYMDELYDEVPQDLACSVKDKAAIELVKVDSELDELWSFVGWKANKQWLWLALDRASRQVVALSIGDRSADGDLGLWQALPERYRARATFHTDDWRAYKQIIPAHQHRFSKHKKYTTPAARQPCRAVFLYASSMLLTVSSIEFVFLQKTEPSCQVNQLCGDKLQPIITNLDYRLRMWPMPASISWVLYPPS